MRLVSDVHRLKEIALLIPFIGLSLLVIGLTFGIAWRQKIGGRS